MNDDDAGPRRGGNCGRPRGARALAAAEAAGTTTAKNAAETAAVKKVAMRMAVASPRDSALERAKQTFEVGN